jgi:cobalt-precorrin-7 (C5)-methyltransferase
MAIGPVDVTIVGCGPGSRDCLTLAALDAVSEAHVLIGPQRLLDLFPDASAERVNVGPRVNDTLDAVESRLGKQQVAVLVTGDPGCFSLAKLILKRFGRERCRTIPGISSVQAAFAAIGLEWADARVVSAHKEDPQVESSLWDADRIAVLGGRKGSLTWLSEALPTHGLEDRRFFVCENLTMDDERITEVEIRDLASLETASRTVALVIRRSLLE